MIFFFGRDHLHNNTIREANTTTYGGYMTVGEERDGRHSDDKSRHTLLVQLVSLSKRRQVD